MGRVCTETVYPRCTMVCETHVKLVRVRAHRSRYLLEPNILIESGLEHSSALESYYVIVFACTCHAFMVDVFCTLCPRMSHAMTLTSCFRPFTHAMTLTSYSEKRRP